MYPPELTTITATTVALKDEVKIEDSQTDGFLTGADPDGNSVVTKVTANGQTVELGITRELPNVGAITVYADGRYIFEPYDDGAEIELKYEIDGEAYTQTFVDNDVIYSNDVMGRITGEVAGVPDGTITLRLYVNKQSTDDSSDTDYQGISYPNGYDVTVDIVNGLWEILPEQLRIVLQEIWWADTLRGDDEIYLQVKMIDPVTGKASDVSAKYAFVADTYAPQATHVQYMEPVEGKPNGSVTALVSGDLSGAKHTHANIGDKVTITYEGVEVGEGSVGGYAPGYGQYLLIDVALTQSIANPDLLKVHVTDKAGNTGVSDNNHVTPLQTDMPAPEVEAYVDSMPGGIVGDVVNNGITNDNQGAIRGTINLHATGGDGVDEIWVFVRGLGPIRVEKDQADIDPATGIWTWTVTKDQLSQLTTTGTLDDGAVPVVAQAYNAASNSLGTPSAEFMFTVDTQAPTIEVTFDTDALIVGDTSTVTFTFSEVPVGFALEDLDVVGGELSGLAVSAENPLVWTATFIPTAGYEDIGSVTVKANSYEDAAGNTGGTGSDIVSVDTKAPTVTVDIAEDTLISGQTSNLTITFSEVPYTEGSQRLTGAEVRALLGAADNVTISDLVSNDGGFTWTGTITPNGNFEGNVTLGIDAGSYYDQAGNRGSGNSDSVNIDTLPPEANNDAASVSETSGSTQGTDSAAGNVLNNDISTSTMRVTEFIVDGTTHTAGSSLIQTVYGTISINADGSYTYTLDNDREATQALNTGESSVEEFSYTVRDAMGNTSTANLNITVHGANDAPVISVETASQEPDVTGGNLGGGSFTSYNVSGNRESNGSTRDLGFVVPDGVDPSTVRAVINLAQVDNTFSILVNGQDIFDNGTNQTTVFQLQANDSQTGSGPNVVALRFADGQWLSTGNPWTEHVNGLPRFQIILTEAGIRFYATRNINSTGLEEIFIGNMSGTNPDSVFPEGLTNPGLGVPDFNLGNNQVTVINPDGTGADGIAGSMTVTTGGTFKITDRDDANIKQATITLEGAQTGDDFVAVLPRGITATETNAAGDRVLTLNGVASLSDYEDAIRSVMFQPGATAGNRTVRIQLTDEYGEVSNVLSGSVNVAAPDSKTLAAVGQASVSEWVQAEFRVGGYSSNSDLFNNSGWIIPNHNPENGLIINNLEGYLSNSTGVGVRNNDGNGIGVGNNGNNAVISDAESLLIDVDDSFKAHFASVTLTRFTGTDSANWYAYNAGGTLVKSGTLNASGASGQSTRREFQLDIDTEFRYLVFKAGTGDFLVDGLLVREDWDGKGMYTLGEFDFGQDASMSTFSMQSTEVESVESEPMMAMAATDQPQMNDSLEEATDEPKVKPVATDILPAFGIDGTDGLGLAGVAELEELSFAVDEEPSLVDVGLGEFADEEQELPDLSELLSTSSSSDDSLDAMLPGTEDDNELLVQAEELPLQHAADVKNPLEDELEQQMNSGWY